MTREYEIAELRIYPVKSCRGLSVDSAELETRGFARDRRFMFVSPDGTFLSQRTVPRLAQITVDMHSHSITLRHDSAGSMTVRTPQTTDKTTDVRVWSDNVKALDCDADNTWIQRALGVEASLVYQPPTLQRSVDPTYAHTDDIVSFADGFPYLVTNTASLARLNDALRRPVPMENFRPNIVVDGDVPFEENEWSKLTTDGVTIELVKPCTRCAVITTDQQTGERNRRDVLQTLARISRNEDGVVFGKNGVARRLGSLHVGEAIRVETK
jgi:uncharacterized protein YcbX